MPEAEIRLVLAYTAYLLCVLLALPFGPADPADDGVVAE
jgi:hypothetical protein